MFKRESEVVSLKMILRKMEIQIKKKKIGVLKHQKKKKKKRER